MTKTQELCAKAHNTKDGRQIDLDIKRTYRNHFMFRDKKGMGYALLYDIRTWFSMLASEAFTHA